MDRRQAGRGSGEQAGIGGGQVGAAELRGGRGGGRGLVGRKVWRRPDGALSFGGMGGIGRWARQYGGD